MHGLLLAAATEEGVVGKTIETTLLLVSLAIVVSVFTRFVRVPYTIALVLTGLAIALLGFAPEGATISHDVVFLLFLPPLLFQAGLHLDLEHLRRHWLPVLVMALPGVVLTTLAVASTVRFLFPESLGVAIAPMVDVMGAGEAFWIIALLFGVVMAPTDPISVMAAFKSANAPDELKTLVEGESLFNDGTAVAIFALLASAVISALGGAGGGHGEEASVSVIEIGVNFLKVSGLGTLIGLGLGLCAFGLIRFLHDHTLETAITVALAWGSFIIAEHLHGSGVIACVVSALIMGNYGKVLHMDDKTVQTLEGFWDSLDFVINSILFLMIGFELSAPEVGGASRLIERDVLVLSAATLGALLLARAIVTYSTGAVLGRRWPRGFNHVIWWAGLKGSLSLALLLVLPAGELRGLLMPIAFNVVLVSLLVQGSTMGWLLRRIGLAQKASAGH